MVIHFFIYFKNPEQTVTITPHPIRPRPSSAPNMPRLAPVAAATAALALLSLLHLSAALPAPHPSRRLPGRIATSLALRRSCPGTQALHLSAAARLRGGDGEDEGEAPAGEGGEESQAEGGAPGQEGAPVAEGAVGEDAVAEAGEAETSGDAVVGGIVEPAGDLRVRRAAFGIVTGSRSKVPPWPSRGTRGDPEPAPRPARKQPRGAIISSGNLPPRGPPRKWVALCVPPAPREV